MATVRISYRNKVLRISPDPVEISLGEKITWILDTDPIVITSAQGGGMMMQYMVNMLRLTIYFGFDFPFDNQRYTAISRTSGTGQGHQIVIETEPAKKLGEYKYGVNLKDDEKDEEIEDEDPIIIVK